MSTAVQAETRHRAQRRSWGRPVLLVLSVVALSATACTPVAAPEETDAAPGAIAWEACGQNLECADVPVPLDWADPDGEQLTLAVIKYGASDPENRIGTILINPGGPGDTGVGLVRGGGADIESWGGGRFDVVSWDPRGTHGSTPVKCFETDDELAAFWDGVRIPSYEGQPGTVCEPDGKPFFYD